MFKLEEYDCTMICKELTLNHDLFHEALEAGEHRYHVKNPNGTDFDIVYYDNNDLIPQQYKASYIQGPLMASYSMYDEYDRESLYLAFFDNIKNFEFEELNEYTIALTRVVLAFTDISVYTDDERIRWFVADNERLHVTDSLPLLPEDETLYVQTEYRIGINDHNYNRLSDVNAFHNLFFFQWILDGKKKSDFRYVTAYIPEFTGICAVLAFVKRFNSAFSYFGLRFIVTGDRIGKFKTEMMDKYFSLSLSEDDATEDNTLTISNTYIAVMTKCVFEADQMLNADIFSDKFRAELEEYHEAVFKNRKTLGILIRGTDYISSGLSGERLMATVPQMIPMIRKWIDEDHYECIFLATEDADILEQMREEFGSSVIAISQERFRVSDFRQGQIISELEKETKDHSEYDASVEDTTINYLYAIYLLSRCESFMCSGQCNGWDVVMQLNEGEFLRSYKFSVGIEGNSPTEKAENANAA